MMKAIHTNKKTIAVPIAVPRTHTRVHIVLCKLILLREAGVREPATTTTFHRNHQTLTEYKNTQPHPSPNTVELYYMHGVLLCIYDRVSAYMCALYPVSRENVGILYTSTRSG